MHKWRGELTYKKYGFRATQRTFSNFIELCKKKRGTKLFANWPKISYPNGPKVTKKVAIRSMHKWRGGFT